MMRDLGVEFQAQRRGNMGRTATQEARRPRWGLEEVATGDGLVVWVRPNWAEDRKS